MGGCCGHEDVGDGDRRVPIKDPIISMKFFRPQNFFLLPEQFQKLLAFLIPIFGNLDGSWRVTSKLRDSTLIQVARRCSKVFQRFSASLVQIGVVQGVPR